MWPSLVRFRWPQRYCLNSQAVRALDGYWGTVHSRVLDDEPRLHRLMEFGKVFEKGSSEFVPEKSGWIVTCLRTCRGSFRRNCNRCFRAERCFLVTGILDSQIVLLRTRSWLRRKLTASVVGPSFGLFRCAQRLKLTALKSVI
jgi:hypothetical protein